MLSRRNVILGSGAGVSAGALGANMAWENS